MNERGAPIYSLQEQLTSQFYEWEVLGRGWIYAGSPVQLEPPFTPFFGHHISQKIITDDGVSHTFLSSITSLFRAPAKQHHTNEETPTIDYTPFPFEDGSLICHTLSLPRRFVTDTNTLFTFLTMLSYVKQPMSIELHATQEKIKMCLVCRDDDAHYINIQLKTYFPSIGITSSLELYEDVLDTQLPLATVDFGLEQEFMRPINRYQSKQADTLTGILSICQHLSGDEKVIVQVLFNGVVNAWTGSILRSVSNNEGKPFFENAPEMLPMAKEKIHTPLFAATLRVATQSDTWESAYRLLDTLCFSIRTQAASAGNNLIPLSDESYTIIERAQDIVFRQSHRVGMLLNMEELALFCHFPSYNGGITKLYSGNRTTKAVPLIATNHPYVVGINNHNGKETPVTLSIEQRTKHMHLLGATGTGKSTLISQLALQDILNGNGIAVIDPHGDLIDEIICRIPQERQKDVILIDPSGADYATGINILEAHSDSEKEVLSSDVVASFKKLSTSWGDQMNTVLANAVLALLESPKGGTLHDLRRFLVEPSFRSQLLATISDPTVLYYWQKEYPFLKTNSIGPILTRLDTFLRPKVIRNMVIQKKGINFNTVLQHQKILLVKLSQGIIGAENSYLLGTLILSKLHQAAFARQQSGASRHPFFIYLDEFHHFITPSVKEMLTGVRKYGVGLILAHQDLTQVQKEDADIVQTILNNAATRIVFRTGEQDAKRLSEGFQSFEARDIQNLSKGEAILRIEQPQYDCSLDTIALTPLSDEQKENAITSIQTQSRAKYSLPKEEVEHLLVETLSINPEPPPVSKKPIPPVQKETVEPPSAPLKENEPLHKPLKKQENTVQENPSAHRYLQLLIKKMAESKGYISTIEATLPDGTGLVDVLLAKEGKQVAVEVSVTTDASWELHNIEKCLNAGYDTVVSVSGDLKQIKKIKTECEASVTISASQKLFFLTPDALFELLDEETKATKPKSQEQVIKGYRVNVSYDAISQEEAQRKRNSIAKVIADAMRKKKK
jgi:Type IV secretion-system coupling protein DNA-binding domain